MELPEGLSWQDASEGRRAPHAVEGGETSDAQRVWVARTAEDRETPIGYLVEGETTARIPYFGRTLRRANYQLLCNDRDVCIEWQPAKLGQVPDAAVAGGKGTKGDLDIMYVARVQHKRALLPAKLLPRAKRAFVSYEGREIARKDYFVMTVTSPPRHFDTNVRDTPAPHGLEWVSVSIEQGAVVDEGIREKAIRLAFTDDLSDQSTRTFIIRASLPRQLAPGGWCVDDNHAYVSYFGHTSFCSRFQMLLRTSSDVQLFWSDACEDDIPDDALLAGKDENGHPVYVARCYIDGVLVAGKVIPECANAFFAYGMDEVARSNYQILCMHVANSASDSLSDDVRSLSDHLDVINNDYPSLDDQSQDSASGSKSRSQSAEKYQSGDSFKVGHVDTRRDGFISASQLQLDVPQAAGPNRPADDVLLAMENENTPFLLVSADFSGYASQLRQQEHQRRTCSRNIVLLVSALFIVAALLTWYILST